MDHPLGTRMEGTATPAAGYFPAGSRGFETATHLACSKARQRQTKQEGERKVRTMVHESHRLQAIEARLGQRTKLQSRQL